MASEIETFMFLDSSGWSKTFPTHLDSVQTWILAFDASNYLDFSQPTEELMQAIPKSQVLGCSTLDEIHGTCLYDQSLSVAVFCFQTNTPKSQPPIADRACL